jgi:hypothetical protein
MAESVLFSTSAVFTADCCAAGAIRTAAAAATHIFAFTV